MDNQSPTKYYCLVESCYEYNDNWYEEGGTVPVSVFTNKEEAEKACLEANYEWFYNNQQCADNKPLVPFYGVGNDNEEYASKHSMRWYVHDDLLRLKLLDEHQVILLTELGYDREVFDSVFSKVSKEDRYLILEVYKANLIYGFQVIEVDFKG